MSEWMAVFGVFCSLPEKSRDSARHKLKHSTRVRINQNPVFMKSLQIAGVVKRDQWSLATGLNNGKPLVVRFRPELRDISDVTGYSTMLDVTWWYDELHSSGMPSAWEAIESHDFENQICNILEADLLAVLTAVVVTDGTIRWIFYTSDAAECAVRLLRLQTKENPYPTRITKVMDPTWSFVWEGVLAPFRRKETVALSA
jgi:hypothetical protein